MGEHTRPTIIEKEEFKVTTALDLSTSYHGRKCIVTGASGIVGSEVVRILLESGAVVAAFGNENEKMKSIKKYAGKEGTNFFKYTVDFTLHPLDLEGKFREAMKDLKGELHHLFVCHGYAAPGGIRVLNLKIWDRCMNVNVRSMFMVVSLAIPFMKL